MFRLNTEDWAWYCIGAAALVIAIDYLTYEAPETGHDEPGRWLSHRSLRQLDLGREITLRRLEAPDLVLSAEPADYDLPGDDGAGDQEDR